MSRLFPHIGARRTLRLRVVSPFAMTGTSSDRELEDQVQQLYIALYRAVQAIGLRPRREVVSIERPGISAAADITLRRGRSARDLHETVFARLGPAFHIHIQES